MNRFSLSPSTSGAPAFLAAALALVATIGSLSPVRADNIFFWVEEVGGNVVFHHQGSVNLSGYPPPSNSGTTSAIFASEGAFAFQGTYDVYDPVIPDTATMPFGNTGLTAADSSTGDGFAISENLLAVPSGYISQTPISGSMTFLSTTIAALGVNPASYTIQSFVGDNTIYMFTSPAEFAADLAKLRKKIRKLQKKAKKAKKQGKSAKAKKLKKKVRGLKRDLDDLM